VVNPFLTTIRGRMEGILNGLPAENDFVHCKIAHKLSFPPTNPFVIY
jgi:hypothetical protein